MQTTTNTDKVFRNRTDKVIAATFVISSLLTIYGFFGLTGFAVIGTVIAVVAIIAVLAWINHITGGLVGWLFLIGSL